MKLIRDVEQVQNIVDAYYEDEVLGPDKRLLLQSLLEEVQRENDPS